MDDHNDRTFDVAYPTPLLLLCLSTPDHRDDNGSHDTLCRTALSSYAKGSRRITKTSIGLRRGVGELTAGWLWPRDGDVFK
jgi:hypothetical protein